MTIDHIASLELGPINLDGMNWEELREFARATRGRKPTLAAEKMFPSEDQAIEAVQRLHQYARNKALAMAHRERGNIGLALEHESLYDRCYVGLPEYAKW